MTDHAAEILADAFLRGCADVSQSIGALAVALRPSLAVDGCQHSEELRDYSAATMGHIRWTCQCGYAYDAKGTS